MSPLAASPFASPKTVAVGVAAVGSRPIGEPVSLEDARMRSMPKLRFAGGVPVLPDGEGGELMVLKMFAAMCYMIAVSSYFELCLLTSKLFSCGCWHCEFARNCSSFCYFRSSLCPIEFHRTRAPCTLCVCPQSAPCASVAFMSSGCR